MKINISKDWFLEKAKLEENSDITAGNPNLFMPTEPVNAAQIQAQLAQIREEKANQLENELRMLRVENIRLQTEREVLIETLIELADASADNMEGADDREFITAENNMVMAIDILKLLKIKYNPMTGQREDIK